MKLHTVGSGSRRGQKRLLITEAEEVEKLYTASKYFEDTAQFFEYGLGWRPIKRNASTYIFRIKAHQEGRERPMTISFMDWGLIEYYARLKRSGKDYPESFEKPDISPEEVRKRLGL